MSRRMGAQFAYGPAWALGEVCIPYVDDGANASHGQSLPEFVLFGDFPLQNNNICQLQ